MAEATPALEIRNLHKRYGELEVLKGISLTARDGDVISILGSSGSGKSTFLRCINLLENPHQGRSWSMARNSSSRPRKTASWWPPTQADQPPAQRNRLCVPELQPLAAHEHPRQHHRGATRVLGQSKAEAIEVAEALLAKSHRRQAPCLPVATVRRPATARAIARTLAMQPKVILFDEPTSASTRKWSRKSST
ncbi:ATP-binding cassette domain-containing protein [Pseudomonas sp. PCH446]